MFADFAHLANRQFVMLDHYLGDFEFSKVLKYDHFLNPEKLHAFYPTLTWQTEMHNRLLDVTHRECATIGQVCCIQDLKQYF